MGRARLQLTIELDQGAEPIRGTLATADDEPERFEGWLGLTRVLQAKISRRGCSEEVGADQPQLPFADPPGAQ